MEMEDDMMEENEELIGKIGLFKLKELFKVKFSISCIMSNFKKISGLCLV
jgi:hypothetical protein